MSHQATAWVAERSKAKGSELLVLYIIANHAHPDGSGSWPSINTIAKESKMSPRGIRYIIERLEELGDLEVTRTKHSFTDKFKGRNEYFLPGVKRDYFYQDKKDQEDEAEANIAPVQGQAGGTLEATKGQPGGKYSATEVEGECITETNTNDACSACGTIGIHRCPGHLSEKQRAKRNGQRFQSVRPSRIAPAPQFVDYEGLRLEAHKKHEEERRAEIRGTLNGSH